MRVTRESGRRDNGELRPTVIEIIAEEEKRDNVFFKWSMGMAVGAHLVFFVLNWNFLAFGGDDSAVEQKKQRIFLVKMVKFTPPPKPEIQQIRRPETKVVNIPDATPDDPEPIRVDEPEDLSYFEDSDMIFEVPGEPPDPNPEGPLVYFPGGELTEPVRIGGPNPVYPEPARRAHIEGRVILECVIGKDGSVTSTKVLRGRPLGLTESAIAAVQRWRFEPSLLNGKPVEVQYILTVNFSLN